MASRPQKTHSPPSHISKTVLSTVHIEKDEVLRAVDDYLAGIITREEVIGLVLVYFDE